MRKFIRIQRVKIQSTFLAICLAYYGIPHIPCDSEDEIFMRLKTICSFDLPGHFSPTK